MAHLIQVGAGSGGMPVLDMVCRDPRVTQVTLIEPDVYKPHNVERHLFPPSSVGAHKATLAERWLKEIGTSAPKPLTRPVGSTALLSPFEPERWCGQPGGESPAHPQKSTPKAAKSRAHGSGSSNNSPARLEYD